jgi:hypothetical protein
MDRHVACTGETIKAYKIWSENLMGKDDSKDVGVDGRTILKWILGK